jgi:cobalt-zinc-cadmium efflux system membrane fusion protein
MVPTGLVLTGLGALAYWGHAMDWKLPKFSTLVGGSAIQNDDWCPAHNVPESACVECKPDLLPRAKIPYCKTHGVPECPLDHPEIAQVNGPAELPRYDVRAALGLLERPEASRQCKLHEHRIQFASAAAAEKAGVDVDVVQERPLSEFVTANGEVAYDQTRVARLSARVPGTVWRVDKKVGDPVRQGEVLALIDAVEVGKAKADFLQAVAQWRLKSNTLDSLQTVAASGAVSERMMREAQAAVSEARIRLLAVQQTLVNFGLPLGSGWQALPEDRLALHVQFLGLAPGVSEQLDPARTTANLLPLTAPLDGRVVAREIVAGEVVDVAKILFIVADPRQMWLTLHVRMEDAKHLALGQAVHFRPDGDTEDANGRIGWISTAVDAKTRTVQVRADLANPDGRLLANTFGQGRIVLREEPRAVAVPKEAVQFDGDCFILFVRDKDYLKEGAPKVFHVRKVRPGAQDERFTEILVGVLPGEVIATKGSAVLQAELLKANLGEG